MVQASTICMGSILFSMGLLLGLVFHLPGASSPGELSSGYDVQEAIRTRREIRRRWSSGNQTLSAETNASAPRKTAEQDVDVAIEYRRSDAIVTAENQQRTVAGSGPARLSKSQSINSNQGLAASRSAIKDNTKDSQRHPDVIVDVTSSSRPEEIRPNATNVTRTVNVLVQPGDDGNEVRNVTEDGRPPELVAGNSRFVTDGIYWSDEAEATAPRGFGDQQIAEWRRAVDGSQVVALSSGCGRMQNRLVLFGDASKACARYRQNTDQVQGEIYSFYLARALGIRHVLPSVLSLPNPREERWRRVHTAVAAAQWAPDKVVILTPWFDGLQSEYIPHELRTPSGRLHPTDDVIGGWSADRVPTLVQWSDLIVFDYLTANLDRVVNNMYNHQWNPDMMNSPTHNLERTPDSGLLVFLDNESGLFHSYRLLEKYDHFHGSLLKSLCVFRRSTADRIRRYIDGGDIGDVVMSLFRSEEPLHKHVHRLPDKTIATLNGRLRDVNEQIAWCQARYGR